MTSFHLSIPVKSIEASVDFFVRVLGAQVSHRDPSGYVNLELFGTQLTLKENPAVVTGWPDFHFGVNLELSDFERIAAAAQAAAPGSVVSRPTVVDAGTPLERKKLYLRCPAGHLIELKGYRRSGGTEA